MGRTVRPRGNQRLKGWRWVVDDYSSGSVLTKSWRVREALLNL